MKEILVIVGTIILAVFLVFNVILGDTNSMRSGANNVSTKMTTDITNITSDTTNP